MAAKVVTAAEVRRALEARHPEDEGEWVVLHEWHQIDTLALRCYTSGLGNRLIAYEVKVSRADFMLDVRRYEKKQAFPRSICHQFFYAMPYALATQCRRDIPSDAGLVAVFEPGGQWLTRQLVPAVTRDPRPLTLAETTALVRHRANPPALRNALLERQDRQDEARRLRAKLKQSHQALALLARGQVRIGTRLVPEWGGSGVVVAGVPRGDRSGIVKVRGKSELTGEVTDFDLGELLSWGYEIRQDDSGDVAAGEGEEAAAAC